MAGASTTSVSSWLPKGWTGEFQPKVGTNRCGYIAYRKVTDLAQTQNVAWFNPEKASTWSQAGSMIVLRGVDSVTVEPWSTSAPTSVLDSTKTIMAAFISKFGAATPSEWPSDKVLDPWVAFGDAGGTDIHLSEQSSIPSDVHDWTANGFARVGVNYRPKDEAAHNAFVGQVPAIMFMWDAEISSEVAVEVL